MRLRSSETRFTFQRGDLLRWLYIGRLTLVTGILVGALVVWGIAEPAQTFAATTMFLAALGFTGLSYWYDERKRDGPGDSFVFLQVLFDAALVTALVHITGGGESDFAFLYILVISSGALLLPLPGGVLVGVVATILYFGDTLWLNGGTLQPGVLLQMALFATVAVVTGSLGDRVRRAGVALGEVESALRKFRLDTGDILASIHTGVLTVDEEDRLVYLNRAGENMLGISSEDWLGERVVPLVEEIAPGLGLVLRESFGRREPVSRFKAVARRGAVETVLGISTTFLEGGEGMASSVTVIFQDITELDRLDAVHRRNERLEAVAELSASLAHEIKNPLASIRSAVEQLSKPGLSGEDRKLLERLVVSESDRLSRLLSDFLEFSALRMETSGEVDLSALARDCIALVRQHPEVEEGVELRGVELDRSVRIPGDSDLLHRAVFNLVLNAAQFAGPAGQVLVEVWDRGQCLSPPGSEMDDPVCLRVSDTGPGVDPQDLPRIFDPFYTNREGGSGLGLAMVHRAVEAHKGAVFVERGEEGGAQFLLYLPGAVQASAVEAQ
ncbi:nitrogen regulation protein NR(II) [Gemmatimonadota bacterium]